MKTYTKDERRALLELPFEEKVEWTIQTIKDTLAVAKRPIVQFSGGADSCVLAWFIQNIDPTVPMVFHDWGLFLPRTKEFVIEFFTKYNIPYRIDDSGYDYKSFLKTQGFPLFKGMKFLSKKDYSKYNISEDCRKLKNICWRKTLKACNPDYYFLGITAHESPQRKSIFINYGVYQQKAKDLTQVKPIVLFKKSEIFKIIKENNIYWEQSSYEDTYDGELIKWHENCESKKKEFDCFFSDLECFMCLTRFKSKGWGRFGKLARKFPKKFKEVMDLGIRDSLEKIIVDYPDKTQYIVEFLQKYDRPKVEGKVAYDLDGVLMPLLKRIKPYKEYSSEERKSYERARLWQYENDKKLRTPIEPEFYIISSRQEKYRVITEDWLIRNNIRAKEVILMDNSLTFNHILEHKLKYLKEKEITKYYEDDPKLIKALSKRLPSLEIIQIERTLQTVKTEEDISIGGQLYF